MKKQTPAVREVKGMKLKDRVALVTGSSKGIGAAIAIEAAREGANVIINYCSDKAGARRVSREIESLGAPDWLFMGMSASRKMLTPWFPLASSASGR